MKVNSYTIHPISVQELKKGHPWITLDEYSEKIKPEESFFSAHNQIFIHDPEHKRVRGRLWSTNPSNFNSEVFLSELKLRLHSAFAKREKLSLKRNHYYLAFAEADELPGLMIVSLNSHIVIQLFSFFWKNYLADIQQIILNYFSGNIKSLWLHERSIGYKKQSPPEQIWGEKVADDYIEEFNYQMQIHLGDYYDYGIYTDMACIREELDTMLFKNAQVLNLFCYTGAFSLMAQQFGAKKIVSVDSFKKVLEKLTLNIKANQMPLAQHEIIAKTSEDFLKNNKQLFDLIICDPPSSYSIKGKRKKSLDFYQKSLKDMDRALKKNGFFLFFLNTHQMKAHKFEDFMHKTLKTLTNKYKIVHNYQLSADCPLMPYFPEGNYLKGILLQKLNQ